MFGFCSASTKFLTGNLVVLPQLMAIYFLAAARKSRYIVIEYSKHQYIVPLKGGQIMTKKESERSKISASSVAGLIMHPVLWPWKHPYQSYLMVNRANGKAELAQLDGS